MKTGKTGKVLSIFLLVFVLQFPFYWLRGGYITVLGLTGIPLTMLVFFIVYFIAAAWLMKRYAQTLPRWLIFTIMLIGATCFEIGLRIYMGRNPLIAFPDLIMRVLAVVAGAGYSCLNGQRENNSCRLLRVFCLVVFLLRISSVAE